MTPQQQSTAEIVGGGSQSISQVQAEPYNGPKARVAVSRFTNKTAVAEQWWNNQIGNGMSDMLTSALFNSGRYIVLEREILQDILGEQDLGTSGRIKSDTAAAIGEIEGAELLFVGAVTEMKEDASGGGAAAFINPLIRVFSERSGIGLAPSINISSSEMAIDVRIIDAKTSRIVATTTVRGTAKDSSFGLGAVGYTGGYSLGGALGSWANTPREKALRACIEKAVEFFISKTPQQYYRYNNQNIDETSQTEDSNETSSQQVEAIYTVKSGDTFGAISNKYTGSTQHWKEIMEYNGISNATDLRVGQTVKIPAHLVKDM